MDSGFSTGKKRKLRVSIFLLYPVKFVSGAASHESVMNLLLFGRMFVVFVAQLCESRDFFQKGKQKMGGFLCSFN